MYAHRTRLILALLIALFAIASLGSGPTAAAIMFEGIPQSSGSSLALAASALVTSTVQVTSTVVTTPTAILVPATATLAPATATSTRTSVPPSATATNLPALTATSTVPAATATLTQVPSTATATKSPLPFTPTKTAVPTMAAPRVSSVLYPLSTSFVVQNIDTVANTASVQVGYFNTTGASFPHAPLSILQNKSATIDQRTDGTISTGFKGSVVLSSTVPIAALVQEYSGNVNSQGMGFRADAYSGWPGAAAASNITMPQLLKGIFDPATNATYNSTVAIQNTDSNGPASVTITYKQNAGGATYSRIMSIPASASSIIDLSNPNTATGGEGALAGVAQFYGTARITSNKSVATVVEHNAGGFLSIYPGFAPSNAATTLYMPQLLSRVYDPGTGYTWGTGVLAMVADGSSANITITYNNSVGGAYSETLGASPMASFDQRTSGALARLPQFYGSATLTSSKPIVAIVNYVVDYNPTRGVQGATYRAFTVGSAGTSVYIPQLSKNAPDSGSGIAWSTGVLGRLLGGVPTTITVRYYHANGTTYTRSMGVSPSSPMFSIDQRSDGGLPNGIMSAAITTSPAQPIAAIVNVVGPSTAPGDALMNFAGISP